ncbi:MAG: LamG-like jellyroll fold domain-containing protein [Flavobacteriales bacterium]
MRLRVLLFALLVFVVSCLEAATFYVTNLNNTGAGSFRQAISDAASNGVGLDTVEFSISGTITLGSAIYINSNVCVLGLGPDQNIVEANVSYNTSTYRVIDIGPLGDNVSLNGLRIRHGKIANNGAGVYSIGDSLTIQNCVIDSNYSTGNQGGGVFTNNSLYMKNCLVQGNYCTYNAGAVGHSGSSSYNSILRFVNVVFSGNSVTANQSNHGGGAFLSYSFSGTHAVSFINCTFKDNFILGSFPNNGTSIHIQPFTSVTYNVSIVNTLLQNTAGDDYLPYAGGGTLNLSRSYTICDDASMSVTGSGNQNSTSVGLGTLADNGGSFFTYSISGGNAARDAGTNSGAPSDDARGFARDASVDIGAFEYIAPPFNNLYPGDIAFTSFSSDGNKRFSFVLLTDISDSTAIYFTDNGWNDTADNWFNTSEGTMLWTYVGDLSCGTEITIDPSQDTASIGNASTPDAGFTISTTGDAILAYQGSTVNAPDTFLAGINQDAGEWTGVMANTSDCHLPDELTDGVNAVAFATHKDNWVYNCTSSSGLVAVNRTALNTASNWSFDDTNEQLALGCAFGCADLDDYPPYPGSGYALEFDGTDDYVISSGSPLNPAQPFTAELWFKANSITGSQTLISQGNGSGLGRNWLWLNGPLLATSIAGSGIPGSTNLSIGDWHHAAVVFTGTQVRLYLDGKFETQLGGLSGEFADGQLRIGVSKNGGSPFAGFVDEVRVWSAALDTNTIRQWMCRKLDESHGEIDNLVSYYRFDENVGSALIDLTGSNDGVLTNMDTISDWVTSGAAIGDSSAYTYGGANLSMSSANGNVLSIDNFSSGIDGIHLYRVDQNANSNSGLTSPDTSGYIGVFKVGTGSYDVTLDFSGNASVFGGGSEANARLYKRDNNADGSWQLATGPMFTDAANGTITLPGQTGTEYVVGFANTTYPSRSGSGYALELDGTDDHVLCTNSGLSGLSTADSVTVELWVNTADSAKTFPFLLNAYGTGSGDLRLLLHNGRPRFTLYDAFGVAFGVEATSVNIADNQWHHLAFSYTGSETQSGINIWVDGKAVATSVVTSNAITTSAYSDSVYIGIRQGLSSAGALVGRLDEIRIWNATLDSTTIRDWMCKKLNSTHSQMSDLLSYYRFDENSGDTLFDLSGGSNGKLTNGPLWVRSGAALGDESKYTYGGSSISIAHSDGDSIVARGFSGSPSGVHVYVVEDTANYINSLSTVTYYDQTRYYGLFHVGDTSTRSNLTYYFANNFNISSHPLKSYATFIARDNNADTTWISQLDSTTADASNDTFLVVSQSAGEFMPAIANVPGGALHFDGTNDFFTVNSTPKLRPSRDFTVEAWVKMDSLVGSQTVIQHRENGGGDDGWALRISGNQVSFGAQNTNGALQRVIADDTIVPGVWFHLAGSYDANGLLTVYVNGVPTHKQAAGNVVYAVTSKVDVGFRNIGSSDYFAGTMDEVRFWSYTRSCAEIQQAANCELTGSEAGLELYFNFNKPGTVAYGTNTGSGSGTVPDESVNNYDGTLFNFAKTGTTSNWAEQSDSVAQVTCDTVITPRLLVASAFGDTIIRGDAASMSQYTDFGPILTGFTASRRFALVNYGNDTLNISSISVANGSAFSVGAYSTLVDTGDTGYFTVYFSPISGTYSDSVLITWDDCVEFAFEVSGSTYQNTSAGSGYALDFDGVNDYVQVSNSALSGFTTQDSLTFEFWVKTTDTTSSTDNLFSVDANPAGYRIAIYIQAGIPKIGIQSNGPVLRVASDATVNDGEWHHIAYRYDGSEDANGLSILVDGVDYGTTILTNNSGSFTSFSFNDTLRIGTNFQAATNFIDATIDEVRVWNALLDSNQIRQWMCTKLNSTHDSIDNLISYYRFDESSGDTLFDLAGGSYGLLTNMNPTTDWVASGAALGDASLYTYTSSSLNTAMSNGNAITLSDFASAYGIHLYTISDTASGSTYPCTISNADSTEYFGVFMVGGTSYDVTIDYSANASINGVGNEALVRGLKRSGGDDATWETASGELRTNIAANTISILNQTGTEYVTGFANAAYPSRPGSGYALDFDGVNDWVDVGNPLLDSGSFTISAWIRADSLPASGQEGIVVRGLDGSGSGWSVAVFVNDTGSVFGALVDVAGTQYNAIGTTAISNQQWHHVAIVYDTSINTLITYLDGVQNGSAVTAGNNLRNSTAGMFVGRGNLVAEAFNGKIDEVSIWNRALTSSEVQAWMCRKLTSSHPQIANLQAYYRFDENQNDTLFDLAGGYDGQLTNMDSSTDWILSGASIGDTSAYDYAGVPVTMGSSYGDSLMVTEFGGSPTGIQVYRVDEAPNNTSLPIGADYIDTTHYYGFFLAGGSSPSAKVGMSYANNSTYTSTNNGDNIMFLGRDDNSDASWTTKASPVFSNFTSVDSVFVYSQPSGTELVAGRSTYLTPPGSGYALDFDNVNDYVVIPHSSSFNVSALTIETWIRWDGNGSAVDFISGKNVEEMEIHMGDGGSGAINSIRFIPTDNVYLDPPANIITPGKWHHIACVYDPSVSFAAIYVDGVSQSFVNNSTNPLSTAITTSTANYNLGIRADGSYAFDGQMDEFRIWNAALDSNVIRKWMCRKLDITHDSLPHLISYFRFDQQGESYLNDIFGGHHGTLTNMDSTTDWVNSGAAIGDTSVYTYGGSSLSLAHSSGDSMIIGNFTGQFDGAQLYLVNETPVYTKFYGAEQTTPGYYFGVHKSGHDTASYDVTYYYGNNATLTGATYPYRAGLAKRENDQDSNWVSQWFEGSTNTSTNTIILPGQTGTQYAGIVSANNALDFDGVNDIAFIDHSEGFNFDTDDDFTISFWVRAPINQTTTPTNWNTIIAKRYSTLSEYPFWIFIRNQNSASAGQVFMDRSDGVTRSTMHSSSSINDNNWHHVAFTKNGEITTVFIDGLADGTGVDSTNLSTQNNDSISIGGQFFSRPFDGSLDELRIWSRALCEDEIQAMMNCELDTIGYDSLVLYYSFNQGVADSINSGLDSIVDQSGNGNNGALSNFALSGTSSNWITGSNGILGVCSPYSAANILVLSEGDTILNGDSIVSTTDSTYFGNISIGVSYNVTYEVYNNGGDTLLIDSVYFSGTDSADFAGISNGPVAPGDTGLIIITVTASSSDTIDAFVHLASNVCSSSPYTFAMQGYVNGYAGALNFDGVNDYVSIADTIGYLGMRELTVEAWVRVESNTGTLQAVFSSTGFDMVHFQMSPFGTDNNVFYNESGAVGLPVFPITPLGTWRHLAMTVKSGDARVFVNGSQIGATVTSVFDSIIVGNTMRIGAGFGGGRFLDGDIDEIRIWDRALDSAEIQAQMHCELEGTECGLIAYYNFNSSSAIAYGSNTGITTLGDSSGNSHDGILTNMALSADSSNWVPQSDSILNHCIDNGDLVAPVVIPVDTLVVWINSSGEAYITASMADSASCDFYSGIDSMWVSQDTVTCANDGDTLYLFVQDSAGLGDSASFIVRVIDTIPPTIVAQNVIIYLDASGNAIIAADTMVDVAIDQCSGVVDSLTIDSTNFDCSEIAILAPAVNDATNFSQNAQANGPVAQTFVAVNTGFLTTISLNLRNGIASATKTLEFYEGDPNTGLLMATESYTLPTSGSVQFNAITLTNPPFLIAGNTYSFRLPDLVAASGQGYGYITVNTYAGGQMYTGAAPMTAVPGSDLYFLTDVRAASNLQTIILTGVDSNGNSASDSGYVVVLDTISPAAAAQNVIAYLDASGQFLATAAMFENGSTDNCFVDSISIDVDTVYCADTGSINVIFTAYDQSGNTDTAHAQLILSDTLNPAAYAYAMMVVYLDSTGSFTITADTIDSASVDNCAIDTIWLSEYAFTCSDTSAQDTVTLYVRDISGNIDSTITLITTLDTLPPVVISKDTTIYLSASGSFTIDTSYINDVSFDNCAIDTMWLSKYDFNCGDTAGVTPVTIYVRDISGNIDSSTSNVTVLDTALPNLAAHDTTIYLDASGNYTIDTTYILSYASDNCAIDTMWLSRYTFNCIDTDYRPMQ